MATSRKCFKHFRSRRLHTASNRLLISLLSSDFILLVNCYLAVYQSFVGAPMLGTLGKNGNDKSFHIRDDDNYSIIYNYFEVLPYISRMPNKWISRISCGFGWDLVPCRSKFWPIQRNTLSTRQSKKNNEHSSKALLKFS